MPTVTELGARLDVPVEDVIRMGEQQVLNPASAIYKAIEDKVGAKLAALKAQEEKEGTRKGRHRVYIQHAVPNARRYELVSTYPQFDIVFTGVDKRAAAVAHAAYILAAEYMFTQFRVNRGNVVSFGVSVKQMVMRSRKWVHVCVPGHVAKAQVEFLKDDRAILAMMNAARVKGKTAPLAQEYAQGEAHIHCTNPNVCDFKAPGGVMVLSQVDTNFRQIAYWMRQHGVALQYYAVPGNKHMEMCTAGPLPELDAYVVPSDDGRYINLSYKNAPSLDFTYTYANYLELVARTTVKLDGWTYHKEFFSKVQGILIYKVTAIEGQFEEEFAPYKSWVEPHFRDKYMVYAPVLKPYGSVNNSADWSVVAHPVERGLIDDVVDHAMRSQGPKDLARVIEQRLFTRTSNYAMMSQIVATSDTLPLSLFELVALSVYTTVFMRKFQDGATISTLAPQAREMAHLARAMPTQLLRMYIGTLVGNMMRTMGVVTDKLRLLYYEAVGGDDIPMPCFSVCPGFVQYSDGASSNPRFLGWSVAELSDVKGFSNMLPGVNRLHLASEGSVATTATSVPEDMLQELVSTGEAFVSDGRATFSDPVSMAEVAGGVFSSLRGVFQGVPDVDAVVESQATQEVPIPVKVPDHIASEPVTRELLYVPRLQRAKPVVRNEQADQLVERIKTAHDTPVELRTERYTENVAFFSPGLPDFILGHFADDARQYMTDAIVTIFPNSLVMNTKHFESDRQYSSWESIAKAIRLRMDVSKLSSAQPESFYQPLISGHVQPNVKETFSTTLHTMVKRNANTPADADPLDVDFLWERAWNAALKVFYVPGTKERLAEMEYIGPTEEHVKMWVSKLDEQKRDRLLSQPDGYAFWELMNGASRQQLMLKGKLKPSLDNSYDTSIKYPQSIQYDPTGKTVAVYSPVIAQKVEREQQFLKPNVLVLQGKSLDDINKFLNNYDWRPNAQGVRKYIEIDYTMYDKSQGRTCALMYLRKCAEFGVLPKLVEFIKHFQYIRTVSSMKAGISADLRDQNPSGASFTLDRNNDTNMLVIAEFLAEILPAIEFVIMMGDDIMIAVRGDVDVSRWESEINRKYNLSMKVSIHNHGYICSLDVVHMPEGHSVAVPDVIKRALSFMDQSVKDEEKFHEKYISYRDNMVWIRDLNVQHYLMDAIPERMHSYMPSVTPEAILMLCKAHARLWESYEQFRGMFASERSIRYY